MAHKSKNIKKHKSNNGQTTATKEEEEKEDDIHAKQHNIFKATSNIYLTWSFNVRKSFATKLFFLSIKFLNKFLKS